MRLIDADKLKQVINDYYMVMNHSFAVEAINLQPTIDPVKHGKWIDQLGLKKCSLCKEHQVEMTNYCPNCGARMDGDK